MVSDDDIKRILTKYKKIAVVGMSKSGSKAAHIVPAFMFSKGYEIIPVNPTADKIMNLKCYPSLGEVTEEIEIVNVFRPSSEALGIVKEALRRKKVRGDISVIWLQEGIRDEEARKLAEEGGMIFVQDRCIYKEYRWAFPEEVTIK